MTDASVTIEYAPNRVRTSLGHDAKLADISFGIEATVNYFFGRSVYRWELTRSMLTRERFLMTAIAQVEPTEMTMSQVAPVFYAVENGIMPKRFKPDELWDRDGKSSNDRWLPDGNHRLGTAFTVGDHNVSIVHAKMIYEDMPLGHLSYGLADMITGLFFRGVESVKWQCSQEDTQLYICHHLTDTEIWEYLLEEEKPDYDLTMTIGNWLGQ